MRVALLLISLLAGLSGPLRAEPPAEDSRACGWAENLDVAPRQAQLVEKRRAKCAELEPYKPGFIDRQILAFEKAERPPITQINLFGLYPRIQTIDHRSQTAGGVRLWRPGVGGSALDLAGNAFWSLQGFQYYDAQAGVIPHRGRSLPPFAIKGHDVFDLANVRRDDDRRYVFYGAIAHRWAPKFDFFGSGPDSRREDQASFSQMDTLVEAVAGYRILTRLTLSGRFGYYKAAIGPGKDDDLPQVQDVFDPAALPGFGAQPRFLRYGAAAVFDGRDVAQNPHHGGLLAVQWLQYDGRDESAPTFDRFAVDGRAYLSLGHPQRVLALRAYASKDDPAAGGRVPFYLLPYLGGSHTLRGYVSQRYRGEKLALLQAEYRWEASPAIELALFADSAAVAATTDEKLERFRTDGGIGLRFKSHESVMLRLDFAWSDEGFRALFRFSPSF
jgi:surface antigen Omp85-like protein